MRKHGWHEWRGDKKPKADEMIEVHGPNYMSGIYDRADQLNWDSLPTDGRVRWSYIWQEWRGGEPPVGSFEPVAVNWGVYKRVYEHGNMVVWQNLRTDGSILWRKV